MSIAPFHPVARSISEKCESAFASVTTISGLPSTPWIRRRLDIEPAVLDDARRINDAARRDGVHHQCSACRSTNAIEYRRGVSVTDCSFRIREMAGIDNLAVSQ